MRTLHLTTFTRRGIASALLASILMIISCSSFVPFTKEEGSFERASEKLAVSEDCIIVTRAGKQYQVHGRKAEIVTLNGARWFRGEEDPLLVPMTTIESITPSANLILGLADTVIAEFQAGSWKFLLREGSLHSIKGTGTSTRTRGGLKQIGTFTIPLSEVLTMEVRKADSGSTILLVLGLGVGIFVLAAASAAQALSGPGWR